MAFGRQHRGSLLRGSAVLGGVLLLWALAPALQAQRVLNEPIASEDASEPIRLVADHAATWNESSREIYLLRGGVVVTQGKTTLRAPDVVVWIDRSRFESERVTHVMIFGDGGVERERNKQSVKADHGFVRMATSSRVDLQLFKSNLVKADVSNDRVFLRALSQQPAGVMLTKPAIDDKLQQTAAAQPKAPVLPPPPIPEPAPDQSQVRPPVEKKGDAAPTKKVTTTYVQVPPELKAEPVPDVPRLPGAPIVPGLEPAVTRPPPQLSVRPRYQGDLQAEYKPLGGDMTAVIVTGNGGITLLVTAAPTTPGGKPTTLDIEADRLVIWTKGNAQQLFQDMKGPGSQNGAHEIYMQGNVELRTRTKNEVETLRADEIYYDVRRGVAVARKADLEIRSGKLYRPLHATMGELIQVNPKLYKTTGMQLHSSILPSDPGLYIDVADATIEERQFERDYLWGLIPAYDKDGKRLIETERIFTGRNMVARLEGVPIFYFPYLKDNIEDPLGPLEGLNLSYNRILGFQFYSTWDVYDLLNLPKIDGTRWRLFLDYLSDRGPAFGTEFEFAGKDLLGTKATYSGLVRLYGIFDRGQDILGGDRGTFVIWPDPFTKWPVTQPDFRGHAFGQVNIQELPDGFTVLGQFSFLSDKNFLEQYFYNTQLNEMNQSTFLYLKQQQNIWWWSVQGQISTREFMTETDWLPKADAAIIGKTFFNDWLVYDARASAGYGRLRPTDQVPFAYAPNDVRVDAGRLDLWQDLSLPFYLGPVKVAPYLAGDLAYYSQDVNGESRGRAVGGGGIRFNMPLSRLYPDVESELFNVNTLYHKINLTGNYFTAASSSRFTNFPQFDRLNDDVTDQSLRDIRPWQSFLNPGAAAFLTTSPIFNPQVFAIRRLIDSNVDTIDQIDVLQLGIRQRLQTKRGFPGNEHVVDWMTLDLGISIFPHSTRDNFGHAFGIAEYDWVWNIGDRTSLSSSGWFEPWNGGPRAFDVGASVQRPDSTAFYLGYRQLDPLNSKAVVASVIYPFSAKYALTASTVWDFGVNVRSYSLFLSRMGTDVMFNFGLNYTSTVNTFGFALEVLPNVARRTGRTSALFPTTMTNIDPMVNQR